MGIKQMFASVMTADEWALGIATLRLDDLTQQGQADNATHPRVRWLRKPWLARYQADPCLVEHNGRIFLYYEEVSLGSTRGTLRCAELSRDGLRLIGDSSMLSLPGHAAYPYVFEHAGAFYCVPETGEDDRTVLYRSQKPRGPWKEACTILEGISALDSTVCYFGDRWWLFSTVAANGPRSSVDNLHIWHAPEPWGPWEPHKLQPAKTDVHSCRSAGRPFVVDGVLYRPAQDCEPQYGHRTVVNRILTLTPDEFAEEVCASIEPDPDGPYRDGLHTLTAAGGLVLVDGYREGPTLNPLKMAMSVLVRLRKRLRASRDQA